MMLATYHIVTDLLLKRFNDVMIKHILWEFNQDANKMAQVASKAHMPEEL